MLLLHCELEESVVPHSPPNRDQVRKGNSMEAIRTKRLAAGILALALCAMMSYAQTARKMKMTTPIPPGISTPDSVQTRLGTLKFIDGFPDDAKGRVKWSSDSRDLILSVARPLHAAFRIVKTGRCRRRL